MKFDPDNLIDAIDSLGENIEPLKSFIKENLNKPVHDPELNRLKEYIESNLLEVIL